MRNLALFAALAAVAVVYPAHAKVSTTCSSSSAVGNGATTAYSFPCKFLATGDLVVKVNAVTQTITTNYTVSGAKADAGGTVTFVTAPGNGLSVTITRNTGKTQLTSLRTSRTYDPAAVEDAIDRAILIAQELNNNIVAGQVLAAADDTPVTITGGSTAINLKTRFARQPTAYDLGAVGDGVTNDTTAINNCLALAASVCTLPAGTYLVTANSIAIPASKHLRGVGKEASIIKIAAAGDVVRMLDVSNASLSDLTVNIGSDAAAVGLHVKATGTNSAFRNIVRGVRVFSPASPTIAGQIGIQVETTGSPNGAWFNDFAQIQIQAVARPIVLSAIANQNHFANVQIEQFGAPGGGSTGYGVESLGDNNLFSGFAFSKGGSSSGTLYGFRFGPTTGSYNFVSASTADIGTVGSIGRFEATVINNVIFGTDSSSGSSCTYDAAATASNQCNIGPGSGFSIAKIRPQIGNLTLDAAGGQVVVSASSGLSITPGPLFIGTGRAITFMDRRSAVFDWPSIAAGAQSTTTSTLTGVLLGDVCTPSMSVDLQGMQMTAYVSSADTLTILMRNGTAGAIDLASATLKVLCFRTN